MPLDLEFFGGRKYGSCILGSPASNLITGTQHTGFSGSVNSFWTHGEMGGWTERRKDGGMVEWMSGWTDAWRGRSTEPRMDE